MPSADERKRRVFLIRLTGCVTYNNAPDLRKAISGLHADEVSHIMCQIKPRSPSHSLTKLLDRSEVLCGLGFELSD